MEDAFSDQKEGKTDLKLYLGQENVSKGIFLTLSTNFVLSL